FKVAPTVPSLFQCATCAPTHLLDVNSQNTSVELHLSYDVVTFDKLTYRDSESKRIAQTNKGQSSTNNTTR
ncbi:hypothetical protein P692DRAFT_201752382, partial [Suillus brevipes Sb2]